ncbi:50S ribosomal protein L22 [Candidatus Woesearchaeota archaeon]|nr:50S ribosomal protein L22 [Candidatus Woesearchaeota archaeon]
MKENMVRACAVDVSISPKQAIEICNHLKGKTVAYAKKALEGVLKETYAMPMRRYNRGGTGHRTGIGPGRYPMKAAGVILKLVKSAESNAQYKGLNTEGLKIVHFCAQRGQQRMHYGRQRGVMKRAHVELVVEEAIVKKPSSKKAAKKAPKKEETVIGQKAAPAKEPVTKNEEAPVKEKAQVAEKPKAKKEDVKEGQE